MLCLEIPELSYAYSHRFFYRHSWTVLLQLPRNCIPDSHAGGPPQNIRAWIKFVTICCQVRYVTVELTLCHYKVDSIGDIIGFHVADSSLEIFTLQLCVNGYLLEALNGFEWFDFSSLV